MSARELRYVQKGLVSVVSVSLHSTWNIVGVRCCQITGRSICFLAQTAFVWLDLITQEKTRQEAVETDVGETWTDRNIKDSTGPYVHIKLKHLLTSAGLDGNSLTTCRTDPSYFYHPAEPCSSLMFCLSYWADFVYNPVWEACRAWTCCLCFLWDFEAFWLSPSSYALGHSPSITSTASWLPWRLILI